MRPSPRFLGAVAAVLVAGVTGGAVLGTVPPMRQVGLADMFPQSSAPAGSWRPERGPPPPDQYAIITPEGRFEIEELSDRGLYRAQQLAWARAYPQPAYAMLDASYVENSYRQPPEANEAEGPAAVAEAPAEPAADAAGSQQPVLASNGPRIIDVTAELAARRQASSAFSD